MKANIKKTRLIYIMVLDVILGSYWINLNGQQFLNPKSRLREWQRRDVKDNPDHIMELIGVKPGMIIGEAGAGDGYFTFHLSRKVGEKGFIFANDIDAYSLEALRHYAEELGVLKNIVTILGKIDDPCFPKNNLDMVIIYASFHDFTKRFEWLKNASRYLKPGGTLAIIDGYFPDHGGLTRELVIRLAEKAGYRFRFHSDCDPPNEINTHQVHVFSWPGVL